MVVATLVIFRLEQAQENRILTDQELWIRRSLKLALLGLASLERTIERQRSRMRWIREGDANSKLFQAFANGRSKNFILFIKVSESIITEQCQKEEVFTLVFENLLGQDHAREFTLDLDYLGLQEVDLQELDDFFTEDEVWQVVKELHPDRAPGPDGFIGAFYQKAWPIIKNDIMAALYKLYVGDGRGFAKLNRALITLLPKKSDAQEVGDFRPISLMHSFPKLFAKMLANRTRKRMPELVSYNQSAHSSGEGTYMTIFSWLDKWHERSMPVDHLGFS